MARTETVEFTNMCMICDGSRVVVIDRPYRVVIFIAAQYRDGSVFPVGL